jgi:hypothetical protein
MEMSLEQPVLHLAALGLLRRLHLVESDRRSLDGNVSGGRNPLFCYLETLSLAKHLLSTG